PTSGGVQPSSCGSPPVNAMPPIVEEVSVSPASIISLGVSRHAPPLTLGFGSEYDGSYFYVDHFAGAVHRLVRTSGTWVPAAQVPGQPSITAWATGLARIADAG